MWTIQVCALTCRTNLKWQSRTTPPFGQTSERLLGGCVEPWRDLKRQGIPKIGGRFNQPIVMAADSLTQESEWFSEDGAGGRRVKDVVGGTSRQVEFRLCSVAVQDVQVAASCSMLEFRLGELLRKER